MSIKIGMVHSDLPEEGKKPGGYATAQKYSWERIASNNLTLYEAALAQKRGTK